MAHLKTNPDLNLEDARRLFIYNPKTGDLICNTDEGRRIKGLVYNPARTVLVDGFNYQVTRLCWFLYYGSWPKQLVDHKDRNESNNRIDNLREATHQQNQQNKIQLGATGYPGVTKRNRAKPYLAKIRVDGARINLGSFYTAEEAFEAYKTAKRKYHGDFSPV